MNNAKLRYNLINIAVILLTLILFINEYKNIYEIFREINVIQILIIVVTVFVVHAVKAGRLYFALYGSDIRISDYIKTYCKVTPVSAVIPFKLGEFFRMYCYGKELGKYMKGIVIVLLDRFMDTIALVTMLVLVWIFAGGELTGLVYILLIFLVCALLVYIAFPGVYRFWKKYLLKAKATERKLAALRVFDALNRIYEEITNVTKGRGIILYFLSLIAWAVEIGSIALLTGLFDEGELTGKIAEYLTSAMGSNQSIELKRFIVISVVLMIAIYVIVKGIEMISGKKDKK